MNTKKAICKCEIKNKINIFSDIYIDKDKLVKNFKDIRGTTNIDVVKCYKLLFDKKLLKKNLGSYILLCIIFINIILLFIFIFKGHNLIINTINNLIKEIKNTKKINHEVTLNKRNDTNAPPKLKNNRKKSNIANKEILLNISKSNNSQNIINNKREKNSDIIFMKIMNNIEDNNKNKNKNAMNYNDYELNSLDYKEALKIDKRTYLQYYLSLLRMKHILIFTFYTSNDYNSIIIKICLLLFSFSLYITVNSLFFTDSTIHKIYVDEGSFNFIYQIPQILYSTIITLLLNTTLSYFSLTQKNILKIKNCKKDIDQESSKIKKCINIKFIIFFVLNFIFLSLFWFFLGCFCAVFNNSQLHLIKDTVISFGLSCIYPFGINLIPGIFRINSFKSKHKYKKWLYIISKILQLF